MTTMYHIKRHANFQYLLNRHTFYNLTCILRSITQYYLWYNPMACPKHVVDVAESKYTFRPHADPNPQPFRILGSGGYFACA